MSYFLLIRLKQFYRIFLELGIVRSLFFLTSLLFLYYLYLKYYYLYHALIIPLSYVLIIASLHVSRKDKEFLQVFIPNFRLILLLEYLLITLPYFFVALIINQWMHLIGVLIFLSILVLFFPLLNFTSKNRIIIKYRFKIPEWYAGIRRYAFIFILLNTISIIFFQNMSVQIGIIVLISLILMSFFTDCEGKEMLESFSLKSNQFIRKRIILHLKYAFFIFIIPICNLLIFNQDVYYLFIILVFIVLSMQLFAIYVKYAFYEQGEELSQNATFHILFFIGFIFPFFTPVAVYFLFHYRKKAIENLNNYLNDSN